MRGEELKGERNSRHSPSPALGTISSYSGRGRSRGSAGQWTGVCGPPTALGAVAGLTAWRHPALGLRHLKDFSAIYCSYC